MKRKYQGAMGIFLLAIFVLFTVSLGFVDVQPVGPNGSSVAYAELNLWVHQRIGVNWTLYHITDWAGVAAILIAFGFAVLGILQWIKRKKIWKVDKSILLLGVYYVLVFGVFVFFEYHVINLRPVLINGILEASYPSSTTMLAICVIPTAMLQFRRLMKKSRWINILCALFTAFMVIGRVFSGVHWFTDVLGGSLFGAAMVLLYSAVSGSDC